MKLLLWIVIIWNAVDLLGTLIFSAVSGIGFFGRLGLFGDASIYSVSLIILAVVMLKTQFSSNS